MKHRNQIATDHQPVTRKSKVNTELVAQLHAYAAATKAAKVNGTQRPHINDFVTVR